MSVWNFFGGGRDFGRFVIGSDTPATNISWDVDYVNSGASSLEICADEEYAYISYSLSLLDGDAFGVDKVSLVDGEKVWSQVYQKKVHCQPYCHDDFIFCEGTFINKSDGTVIDVLSFPGCDEGFYCSFISDGKIFLSNGVKGGFWCELSNLSEMKSFKGDVVCFLNDGRVVKSEAGRFDVLSSGVWRSNSIGLNVGLGQVVSYQGALVCFENGLHVFEVDKDGLMTKSGECGLPAMPDESVLMRGDDSVILLDLETGLVTVYGMVTGEKKELCLELDSHIGYACCIRGDVLYGTLDDLPIGYSLTTGEVVWKAEYPISTRTVIATKNAVLYQFVAGAVQAYNVNGLEG